jgi:hypothetical protein
MLADGVAADDVDRWVLTASIRHSNGDAIDIAVKDGRIVGVRGRADGRVNHGGLVPKDLFGWQATTPATGSRGRLLRRDGELVEAAYANGQRFVSKGGRERADSQFSDQDASWGHRSAVSTRKGGGYYGYKLDMAVCTATDLPLAWDARTARDNESIHALPLMCTHSGCVSRIAAFTVSVFIASGARRPEAAVSGDRASSTR